ncbi:Dihydrolipoyl dehydrogenase [Planctomycetes bacterium Pan216]|uniref:Dihydrolipoyl dehydrogenase n=1 Tax=Kolteria novifilia TaxID=2527975 RepID=A0A518B4C7_9BACT|nr:Dihydrolipoyl dehydrogenase [Planctomycetes bacterium Pan216]
MAGAVVETEVVVLGGGPGGYAAAFHAADHGMKVALVDLDTAPGGVCLHRGCIPSKALLHAAKLLNETREANEWGLSFGEPKIDLDRLRGWKNEVVDKLTGGVRELCQRRGVDLIRARGTFKSSQSIALEAVDDSALVPTEIRFEHGIIATGSVPAMPEIFRIGDERVMDSTGGLDLKDVPKKMLVIGGGYIGLEMGTVYAALGSEVTVVEFTDGLLPGADRDLVRPLAKRLEKQFANIHLKSKVDSLEAKPEGIVAHITGEGVEPEQLFDRVLVAVGRRPNSANLGLETTKVKIDEKGFVEVDSSQATADPHLFAIGDIAGEPMLAHKASREAKIAVEVIAGEPAAFDNIAIPAVVFTDPEIAWCGLTENEVKKQKKEVAIVRFPWGASGRALTLNRTEGMTKLLVDPKTERILGVGIVGVGAGELISEGILAVETAAVARDLGDSIHPHPTLTETMMESAEAVFGQATHMYRPKK